MRSREFARTCANSLHTCASAAKTIRELSRNANASQILPVKCARLTVTPRTFAWGGDGGARRGMCDGAATARFRRTLADGG
eukprot:6125203-Prymnesium_polylepis.1